MPSKPVERVLSGLENVTELSSGWTALCPSHDDNMNSLSIGEGFDGRALIHCHAGCEFESVVAVLGLKVGDLFVYRRPGI
jgi:putative DNA primase/helicase